jgi:regulator of protease activity HflC (stomatin/prohibitin superfamily)
MDPTLVLGALAGAGVLTIMSSLRVLYEYQRGVVFRLGKLTRARGPGLVFLLPFGIERMNRVDLRIVAMDIPPQDTITRDNVSVRVNAVVYFRVADPTKAINEIEDYYFATSQLAQTTLRSVIGQSELDEVLAERDQVNETVRQIIDQGTDPWGIEVVGVEVKDIDLPQEMKRAMARQAEAERERRGKVIAAEGEFQASMKLAEAAKVMGEQPMALQLRFLQTVVEIAAENNSTTLFPIPIDLFRPLLERMGGDQGSGGQTQQRSGGSSLPGPSVGTPELMPGDAGSPEAILRNALGMGSGGPSGTREEKEKAPVEKQEE